MTHTPGPWVLGTYDHASYNITGPHGHLPLIAKIPADRDNRQANARLIADLLAALQAIDRALIPMDYSEYRHADELSSAINAVRSAIAKAIA